jgi:uncharacterized protein
VTVCGSGLSVTPTTLTLPVANATALEAYEGMLVEFKQTLTVNEVYNLGRYGELVLAQERLYQPYSRPTSNDPVANADFNARSKIILDDGSTKSNPNPIPHLSSSDINGTRRVGDTVQNLKGVLSFAFDAYRIQPTQEPSFVASNPRPAAPANTTGTLRAGSLNVLNYFTTFGSNDRGANNTEELDRQTKKLITTIVGLNADVLGLMEIQNNATGAIGALVKAVNDKIGGPPTYSYINSGKPGTDAIKVAIIYKANKVKPLGNAVVPNDAGFSVDGGMRPPVAQRFAALDNNGSFWFVVNHFKSKGGCPKASNADNLDKGQGCWNAARITQATTLKDWVATLTASSGENDVLMVGDFNAYLNEQPLKVLEDNGYESLLRRVPATERYSYVFNGETGALDHAFASTTMKAQVNSVTVWHINADEPLVLDYNKEFKTQNLFSETPYRSSDHDPVLLGITLTADAAVTLPSITADLPVTTQVGNSVSINNIVVGTGITTLSVDWGDGSAIENLALSATSASKTYSSAGTFTIRVLGNNTQNLGAQVSGDITITGIPPVVSTGGNDLFFSEYVEGSSNNKAIEIYNPTANVIDLSLYKVKTFANGATTTSNVETLAGTIAPNETLTFYNSGLNPAAVSAILGAKFDKNNVVNFNGDDAVILEKNGVTIDAIGQVGIRPVTEWVDGTASTKDKTLRRKAGITQGSIPPATGTWNISAEWDVLPIDTFDPKNGS